MTSHPLTAVELRNFLQLLIYTCNKTPVSVAVETTSSSFPVLFKALQQMLAPLLKYLTLDDVHRN